MEGHNLMEHADTIVTIAAVLVTVVGGVLAVRVDLAKLHTDMEWVKKNVSRIWEKIDAGAQ